MTKVVVLADLHFGARRDSPQVLDNMEKFYSKVFFPYIDKYGLKTILNLGDTFDRRTQVNFQTLERSKKFFFNPIKERGLEHHVLLGNHDVYFKNTNRLNSIEELILPSEYDYILYGSPTETTIHGCKILMLPWITADNEERSMSLLKKSTARLCLGHLAFDGFEMQRGNKSKGGLNPGLFDGFDLTLTGHFHTRSRQKNVMYVGSPYGMDWSDYNDPRGFHVLDLETMEMEFIENPYSMFNRIIYDKEPPKTDLESLRGSYVRLVVADRGNGLEYDDFVARLEELNLAGLTIMEDKDKIKVSTFDVEDINVDDTSTIIKKHIDSLSDLKVDKERLTSFMLDVYSEASTREI